MQNQNLHQQSTSISRACDTYINKVDWALHGWAWHSTAQHVTRPRQSWETLLRRDSVRVL